MSGMLLYFGIGVPRSPMPKFRTFLTPVKLVGRRVGEVTEPERRSSSAHNVEVLDFRFLNLNLNLKMSNLINLTMNEHGRL